MSFFDTVTKHLFPVPVLVIGLSIILTGVHFAWKGGVETVKKRVTKTTSRKNPYSVPPSWRPPAAANAEGFQTTTGTAIGNAITGAVGGTVQTATSTAAGLVDTASTNLANAVFGSYAVTSVGPTGQVVGSTVGNTAGSMVNSVLGSAAGNLTGQVIGTGITTAINTAERAVGPAIKLVNSLFAAGAGCTADTTPTPKLVLGPYRKNAAGVEDPNVIGTNVNDIRTPVGRSFEATPLDTAYDEYEQAEATTQVAEADRLSQEVVLTEEDVADVGGLFSPTDFDITSIPWDAENVDSLPKDVLWGIVSKEASKSLFLKVYKQTALSVPDVIQDFRPGDETSPPAFNLPDLPVNVIDPYTSTAIETLKGIGVAIGQNYNPLNIDNIKKERVEVIDTGGQQKNRLNSKNSSLFDAEGNTGKKLKKLDMKLEKISKSNMKGAGSVKKMKNLFKKIKAKLQKKVLKSLQKFMQKKLIKGAILRLVAWANVSAASSAAAASLGILSFLVVIATIIATIIEMVLSAVDAISTAAGILLPVILEKFLDGEGICPPGTQTINELIPDETAYFFFTSFVPIGDLADLFGPYICWDGLDTAIKQRIFEPTYTEDKTLSLAYHTWPDNMKTKGDQGDYGKNFNGTIAGYTCTNGICRENCSSGTVAEGDLCKQFTKKVESTSSLSNTCDIMKSKKEKETKQNIGEKWEDQPATGVCFEPYSQGDYKCETQDTSEYNFETGGYKKIVCSGSGARGCGCVRATKAERAYCPDGFTLDTSDLRCYKCDSGMKRQGNLCMAATETYARRKLVLEENKWKVVPGYNLPETLEGLSVGVNEFQPNFLSVKPYTPFCNFASPVMLDRMAQFYYDQSYLNPDILEVNFVDPGDTTAGVSTIRDTPENRRLVDLSGGPILIQWDYITRFYGVIASSELSCDVACEIRTMTYNPITGASFSETIGCSNVGDDFATANDFQKANNRCYRRFYFTKLDTDPQGIFTVTGCTNSDGTAPDAQVNSWEEGVEYVPSLPKMFTQRVCDKPTEWNMDDLMKIGINYGGEKLTEAVGGVAGPAGGMLAGPAISFLGSKLSEEIDKSKKEGDMGTPFLTKVADPKKGDQYIINANINYVTLKNTPATALLSMGPIVEQAEGVVPIINRCESAVMTDATCGHKYVLRDTIREYEKANPTRRVKQVDVIEPRGGRDALGNRSLNHGCYYQWKEVEYDPETNKESTNFKTQNVVYKYEINDTKTCVFRPVGLLENFSENDYPIRTMNLGGSLAYPTRKKVTKPVRFVRIEGGTDWLELSQVVVLNTDFANVSKGRVPTATPAYDAATPATNATDGNALARTYPNIYHSNTAQGAFFEIDLGKEHFIQSITVYTRKGMNKDADMVHAARITGYKVRCLDASRAMNYEFTLDGKMKEGGVDVLRESHVLADFPVIDLQRRRPYNSFAVPLGLPPDVNLGGLTTTDAESAQVFHVGGYTKTKEEAESTCARYGARVATKGELEVALAAGASWCSCGWVKESSSNPVVLQAQYPNNLATDNEKTGNCGTNAANPVPGIRSCGDMTGWNNGNKAGVNCYGRKPPQGTTGINAFAANTWFGKGVPQAVCPTKCSDETFVPQMIQQFNTANPNTKIMKVLKAWTPKPNRCDFEVEMMRMGTDGSKRLSKETTFVMVERDGATCNFRRVSDGAANVNSGTYIQSNTPFLTFSTGAAEKRGISAFEAVTGTVTKVFGKMIQTLQTTKPLDRLREEATKAEKETGAVLTYVAANQTLQGCPTKCSDPSVLGAIFKRYNEERGGIADQFGAERSVMSRILRAVGASPTECDIMYEEQYESYEDALYPPTQQESRVKAVRVKMVNQGDCKWGVAPGSASMVDVSGGAAGLKIANFARAPCKNLSAPWDVECLTETLLSQGWSAKGTAMPAASPAALAEWNKQKDWATLNAYAKGLKEMADITLNPPIPLQKRILAIQQVYGVTVTDPATQPFARSTCNNTAAPYNEDCLTQYLLSKGWSLNGTGMPSKIGMAHWNKYTTWPALQAYVAQMKQTADIGSDSATSSEDRTNAILFLYGVTASDPSSKPFSLPQCPVDCRAPARLKELQGRLNAAASRGNESVNFRQVVQSFQPGPTRCEYKILKDVTTTDPYTKKFDTTADIETYVTANYVQTAAPAPGATNCTGVTYALASSSAVQEFPSDPDTEIDPETGEEIYVVEGKQVTPPMLFSYDPTTTVSSRVNATPVSM